MSVTVVQSVKAELLAHPRPDVPANLAGPCGAFAITCRVAWALRSDGWGLVASQGNGCSQFGANYRTDTLMKRDGSCKDILIKSESDNGNTSNPANFNIPSFGDTGPQDPTNWRAPFNADAGAVDPPVDPPVNPPVTPPGDNSDVIEWLEGFEQRAAAQLQHLEALIKQTDDANERRYRALAAQLNSLSEQISVLTLSGRVPAFGGNVTLTQP